MEHGTMVLSVMAADVEHYYVGAAPRASYVLVRCEDEQTESLAEEDYWASAVEYADSLGVDVINSSLGYHGFDDKTMDYKYENLDGKTAMISCTAAKLASKGIILVNSAGNEGMGSWKKINVPADASDILTVGAITRSGINAPFSSIGFTADGRVKPDVMAIGSPASVLTGRGTVINDMGTSFSAPIIAGMVACLWQALPHLNAYEIMSIVKRSSDRYSRPNNIFGYGVPDFWKAYLMGKKDK
jgi:subtilisin family serine protease